MVGFEYRSDASRFWADLRSRLAGFALKLHAEKTRLIEFGRFAAERRRAHGRGKPETFQFLGFTHICARTRRGRFKLKRITDSKRMRAKVREVKISLIKHRDLPIPDQARWLASVLRGHCNYYAVPDNYEAISAFRQLLVRSWLKALRRRSQRSRLTWPSDVLPPRGTMATDRQHPAPLARASASTPEPKAGAQCVKRRTLGSVRGAACEGGPYRDRGL